MVRRMLRWLAVTAGLIVAVGVAMPAGAVVGGRDTSVRQYPWMVLLSDPADIGTPSGQFCGGALVAPTKVVTAAHCVDDRSAGGFQAIGGRSDLRTSEGTTRGVRSIWRAPQRPAPQPRPGDPAYIGGGDLSVLTLDAPMPYRTLRLATRHDAALYRPGRQGLLLGWGIYREEGLPGPSPILQQGSAPLRSYATCNNAAKHHPAQPFQLDPRYYVCAGRDSGGVSACGGDSGGPLVVGGRLVGVFGPSLSRNGKVCESAYSGYTRTDVYARLIAEQLRRPA